MKRPESRPVSDDQARCSFSEEVHTGFPPGFGGWNPSKLPQTYISCSTDGGVLGGHDLAQANRQQNQCHAYLGWVNAQLKKKPGTLALADLCAGMNDGTAFADLIEVVAEERIADIVVKPSLSDFERLSNIKQIIAYMKARHIRMHDTSPEDIVAGNLKAIMRLILALAAYFKPNAVKHSGRGTPNGRAMSVIDYAQSASLHLANARREAGAVIPRPARPPPFDEYVDPTRTSPSYDPSRVYSHPPHRSSHAPYTPPFSASSGAHLLPLQKSFSQDFARISEAESRCAALSRDNSALSRDNLALSRENAELRRLLAGARECAESRQGACAECADEMRAMKEMLTTLQQLLLDKAERARDESVMEPGSLSARSDSLPLTARSTRSEPVDTEAEEDVSDVLNQSFLSQMTETSAQQQIDEQQGEVLRVAAALAKANYSCEALASRNDDLERKLLEQDELIIQFRRTLRDKEEEILKMKNSDNDELQLVRESLKTLGTSFSPDNDRHRSIDRVDSDVCTLVNHLSSGSHLQPRHSPPMETGSRENVLSNDVRLSNIIHGGGSRLEHQGQGRAGVNGHGSTATKVMSYLGSSEAPTMTYICKRTMALPNARCRLGDITLLDVKKHLIKSTGSASSEHKRYHFRTQHPDHGLRKEEISNDEALVPSWEGAVMVWVDDEAR